MKTFFERLETYPSYLLILATILILLVLLLLAFGAGKTFGAAIEKRNLEKKVKSGRNDAIKRSRAVLSGQMIEQVAPYLPQFPCNPADARFVGKPIDFIAFPGAADGCKKWTHKICGISMIGRQVHCLFSFYSSSSSRRNFPCVPRFATSDKAILFYHQIHFSKLFFRITHVAPLPPSDASG